MKLINKFKNLFAVLVLAVANSSCTEKIELKLKDAEPQLVIEARISDKSGPQSVVLTKSKLYSEDNMFNFVTSALVILTDNLGNLDTLKEVMPGLYQTLRMQGVVGRTYYLRITTEGTTYLSSCKMNEPVPIDSLYFGIETDFSGNEKIKGKLLIHDPLGVRNYYRIFSVRDGYHGLQTDRLWDGKERVFNVSHKDLKIGDTLEVELWSIDEHIWEYFRQQNLNQNTFSPPAAPATPTSVFIPEALGYFSAHSVTSKIAIVK